MRVPCVAENCDGIWWGVGLHGFPAELHPQVLYCALCLSLSLSRALFLFHFAEASLAFCNALEFFFRTLLAQPTGANPLSFVMGVGGDYGGGRTDEPPSQPPLVLQPSFHPSSSSTSSWHLVINTDTAEYTKVHTDMCDGTKHSRANIPRTGAQGKADQIEAIRQKRIHVFLLFTHTEKIRLPFFFHRFIKNRNF